MLLYHLLTVNLLRNGVPVLPEILLKMPKSAGLANTLPNVCQEDSNQIESKKEEYNN